MLANHVGACRVVVRSSELGTPFNEEVERLQRMVAIAQLEEVVVSLLTETGRMSESPDTVTVLCNHAKGLGIALDPSYFIYGRGEPPLHGAALQACPPCSDCRDTKKDKFQVRVGQGDVEYGKLIARLERYGYKQALSIDIVPQPDVDQAAELRKFRLLLESLL